MIDIKDFKVMIGFYEEENRMYYSRRTKIFCNCGYTTTVGTISHRKPTHNCPTCGEMEVKRINRPARGTKTVVDGMIDCIEKDDKSFRIRKTEVIADAKNDGEIFTVNFITGKVYELFYSLKTKEIKVFKDGVELANNETNVDIFFKGQLSINAFLDVISNERNRDMYKLAIDFFAKEHYERSVKIGRALRRLFKYPAIELLNSCGFKNMRYIFNNLDYAQSKATKPNEVMRVSKMAFNMLRDMENISWYTHDNLIKLEKNLDGNTIKEVLQIMREEAKVDDFIQNADLIITLREQYGYRDMKKLMLYVCREVKLQQGIERPQNALQILRDYARMCKDMGIEYEKYPKSLKKDHDIAQMNYNVKKDVIKAEKFIKKVESEDYYSLAYTPRKEKDKDKEPYVIVVPKESSDLIKEGDSLSHCVASYVDDVINGKCKILFMRLASNPDQSFITIEVRDGNIRQARGSCNRNLTNEEWVFVRKWAERKELIIATH